MDVRKTDGLQHSGTETISRFYSNLFKLSFPGNEGFLLWDQFRMSFFQSLPMIRVSDEKENREKCLATFTQSFFFF